jgi:hypothetical protein
MASNLGRIQQQSGYRSYGSQRKSKYMYIWIDNIQVHVGRVICEIFNGPPPSNKHIVDHIDENRSNNQADNLQWLLSGDNIRKSVCKVVEFVNLKENIIIEYSSATEASKATGVSADTISSKCVGILTQDSNCYWRYKENCSAYGKNTLNRNGLAVKKFNLDGTLVTTFPSISEAVRDHITNHDPELPYKYLDITYIIECCKGQREQIGGFKWEYVTPPVKIKSPECVKAIKQYSKDGTYIRDFPDVDTASTELKIPRIGLMQCCNGHSRSTHGFIFKFATDQSKVIPLSVKLYPTHYEANRTLIKRYESCNEASKDIGVNNHKIHEYAIGNKKADDGTIWKYEIKDKIGNFIVP